MRAEVEVPFEDVVLRIPSDEIKPGFGLHQHLPLSLISGRALVRDSGCGDVELLEVRIEPPVHGQKPWTMRRPHNVRPLSGAAVAAGALFRWFEASILADCRDRARDALDDVERCDHSADAAWEARV